MSKSAIRVTPFRSAAAEVGRQFVPGAARLATRTSPLTARMHAHAAQCGTCDGETQSFGLRWGEAWILAEQKVMQEGKQAGGPGGASAPWRRDALGALPQRLP